MKSSSNKVSIRVVEPFPTARTVFEGDVLSPSGASDKEIVLANQHLWQSRLTSGMPSYVMILDPEPRLACVSFPVAAGTASAAR